MSLLKGQHGDYRLQKEIGHGQFSVVYLAQKVTKNIGPLPGYDYYVSNTSDKPEMVAAKRIPKAELSRNPKYEQLFISEKQVMRSLNHPNLLGLLDEVETETDHYLITEYLPSGNLTSLLATPPYRLPEQQAVFYLKQLLSALQYLHGIKVMHRDLKPDNVFMDGDRLVLGDFGFSTIGLLTTGSRVGTPYYMAPEVLFNRDGRLYTSKVDLYSLGVVYYQMLFGKVPFAAQTMIELEEMVLAGSGQDLKFPEGVIVSEDSKKLLRGLIEKDPIERISWKGFFSHSLFRIEALNSYEPTPDICTNQGGLANPSIVEAGKSQGSLFKNQLSIKVNQTFEDQKRSVLQEPDCSFVEDAGIFKAVNSISSRSFIPQKLEFQKLPAHDGNSKLPYKSSSVGNNPTKIHTNAIQNGPQLTDAEFGSFGSNYPYNNRQQETNMPLGTPEFPEQRFHTAVVLSSPKGDTANFKPQPVDNSTQQNSQTQILDYFHHERNKVRFFMSTAKKGRSLSKNPTIFEKHPDLLEAITLASYLLALKGVRLSNFLLLALTVRSNDTSFGPLTTPDLPVALPANFQHSAGGQKLQQALQSDSGAAEQYLAHLAAVQSASARTADSLGLQQLHHALAEQEEALACGVHVLLPAGVSADVLDLLLEFVGCVALCRADETALAWKAGAAEGTYFDWTRFQEEGVRGLWRSKGWDVVRIAGENKNRGQGGLCGNICGGIGKMCS